MSTANNTPSFTEVFEAWIGQEEIFRLEGRRGVEALCQIAGAVGYKDPQHYGQLTRKAVLGDLICMLEDNSGLVEAMIEWVQNNGTREWKESLESQLINEIEDDEPDMSAEGN